MLWLHFEQATERRIHEEIQADTADAEMAAEATGLR